ncbi:hypothetical protein CSKR_200354 [Clonorchis sinensis]|uniref:Uncharacterized protein n=1 Tax=Clonorchis sinensis TaxID=79923 RepID=A0A8T1MCU7_CLOSI|nr:hypothetical protein CSKR_200354 [Clonorchis sinensis]
MRDSVNVAGTLPSIAQWVAEVRKPPRHGKVQSLRDGLLSVTDDEDAAVNTRADLDMGECCENPTTAETVELPISSSTPSKVASLIVDTVVAQDSDNQSPKTDNNEPESPAYTRFATLISGDSDVYTSAKERRLEQKKPHTIRQIRKLLVGIKFVVVWLPNKLLHQECVAKK